MRFKQKVKQVVALSSVATMSTGVVAVQGAEAQTTKVTANKTNAKEVTNVIYIVLDDIGFSDLGVYGSEIKTPNIDALAANGLTYNNFNACPMSSATRASLLTGRENNSVGVGQVSNVSLEDNYPGLQGKVSDEAGMISEILKTANYNSYGVGKWHLSPAYTLNPAGPFDSWPLGNGFDRYYGFMDGETDQYSPQLVNGNEMIEAPNVYGYNLNDDLSEHALQYITDHVSIYPNKGFFLNYAFGTGHSPQQVSEDYIDMYDGVYADGWDVIREQRFEKQKATGIIPKDAKLGEYDSTVAKWDTLSKEEKELSERFMQCYAGYITQADDEVGKLVDRLKELGVYDNTMIVLIGDNGATDVGGPFGTDSFIGGMSAGRFPTAQEMLAKMDEIGGPDMAALYPKGWAQVSNTPFAHYKGGVYNGSLRNPLIVSLPSKIKDVGTIREQYVSVTDITPTVLDVLGVKAPNVIKGVEQMPMYGKSFASTFKSADAKDTTTTSIKYIEGSRMIYNDGWKAVSVHVTGTPFEQDTWELYDTVNDFSETTNLADKYPEKLKELISLFDVEAAGKNIYPLKESNKRDMGYVRSDSPANKSTFTYYRGMGNLNITAAPQIAVNNYTISTTINRDSVKDEGVIAAMGDEIGGYSFYIQDNKLVYVFNRYGTLYEVKSNIAVPTGEVDVAVKFEKDTMMSGKATLFIDGKDVGNVNVQTAIMVTLEGLSIGRDAYKAVSPSYAEKGDFEFTGDFESVVYELTPFIPSGAAH